MIGAVAARVGLGLVGNELVNGQRHAALSSGWLTDATWEAGTLTLTMNGNNYDYPDADGSLFEGISSAPSPGQFYNERIKSGPRGTGNRATGAVRTGLLTGRTSRR